MVEGLIDIGFKPFETQSPVDICYPAGELGSALILPAILNETVRLLKAEGAAFIRYDADLKKVHLERCSNGWDQISGTWLNPVGNIMNLISSTGQTEFKDGMLTVTAHLITRQSPETKVLAYTPLFDNGYNLGALWIGHQRRLTTNELVFLKSMGDVLAHAIYCLSPAHQKETVTLVAIQALVDVLATWDNPTYQHSLRLISSARATARRLGCGENEIQTIGWAALLHDVGKLCVPKEILYKSTPLTGDDWRAIRRHPQAGARILEPVESLRPVAAIILASHEKYDGSGYPAGISGGSIPIGARVISVADAYCAMTEEHDYRGGLTHEEAVQEIRRCSGGHFDPIVAEAFLHQFN